jgi:sulfur carrier protein ThiS
MATDVFLPSGWQRLGVDRTRVVSEAATLEALLEELATRWPSLAPLWRPPSGRGSVRVYLNGEPIGAGDQGRRTLRSGDCVDFLQPISGG